MPLCSVDIIALAIVWWLGYQCGLAAARIRGRVAATATDCGEDPTQDLPPEHKRGQSVDVMANLRELDELLRLRQRGSFGGMIHTREVATYGKMFLIDRPAWTLVLFDAEQTPTVAAFLRDEANPGPFTAFWWPERNKLGLGWVNCAPTGILDDFEHVFFEEKRWVHIRTFVDLTKKETHGLLPLIAESMSRWVFKTSLDETAPLMLVLTSYKGVRGTTCMRPVIRR